MSQKTVLTIEDSANLADSLEDMLIAKGYNSIKATTGKQGLDLAINEKPDLILLDLRLPDIDGLEIFKSLKNDTWGKTAKILILTASDFTASEAPDLKISSDIIIYKSHNSIEEIARRIESELSN